MRSIERRPVEAQYRPRRRDQRSPPARRVRMRAQGAEPPVPQPHTRYSRPPSRASPSPPLTRTSGVRTAFPVPRLSRSCPLVLIAITQCPRRISVDHLAVSQRWRSSRAHSFGRVVDSSHDFTAGQHTGLLSEAFADSVPFATANDRRSRNAFRRRTLRVEHIVNRKSRNDIVRLRSGFWVADAQPTPAEPGSLAHAAGLGRRRRSRLDAICRRPSRERASQWARSRVC